MLNKITNWTKADEASLSATTFDVSFVELLAVLQSKISKGRFLFYI